jgi:hypothetical protein
MTLAMMEAAGGHDCAASICSSWATSMVQRTVKIFLTPAFMTFFEDASRALAADEPGAACCSRISKDNSVRGTLISMVTVISIPLDSATRMPAALGVDPLFFVQFLPASRILGQLRPTV